MTSSGLNHWILFERANPRRRADIFFREGGLFFEKHENCTDRTIFRGILYYRKKLVKNVFCIYFSVYVAFLLSVTEQAASAIFQYIILSLWRYFAVLGHIQACNFSRKESIR